MAKVLAWIFASVAVLGSVQACWLIRANREMQVASDLQKLGATVEWAWRFDSTVHETQYPGNRPACWLVPGDSFVAGVRLLECDDLQVDKKLANLESLVGIRRLALTDAKISDATLRHLAGLAHLEWLNLYTTSVSDNGLEILATLKSLRWVNLCGTRVTPAGVAFLRSQLPRAEIFCDFDRSDTLL